VQGGVNREPKSARKSKRFFFSQENGQLRGQEKGHEKDKKGQ
jgi:hypothetical protein